MSANFTVITNPNVSSDFDEEEFIQALKAHLAAQASVIALARLKQDECDPLSHEYHKAADLLQKLARELHQIDSNSPLLKSYARYFLEYEVSECGGEPFSLDHEMLHELGDDLAYENAWEFMGEMVKRYATLEGRSRINDLVTVSHAE